MIDPHRFITQIHTGDHSLLASVARLGLTCLEQPYKAVVTARNIAFDRRWRRIQKLSSPVISVGNITIGGTGKTPMVAHLARRLQAWGANPAVLLRGYRGHSHAAKHHTSDEAAMLSNQLGDAIPVVANPDRVRGAEAAMIINPRVNVFLLDDGFQHRTVHRDVDLVLVDATCPFGFNHLLPCGFLREPVHSLRRATAMIVTRADQPCPYPDLDDRIEQASGQRPIAHTAHRWEALRDASEQTHPLDVLSDANVVGMSGIANPAAFEHTLRQHAGTVIDTINMPDHHHYTRSQVESLLQNARQQGANAVVTTEKDWVKWHPLLDLKQPHLPVYRPDLQLSWLDGAQATDSLLRRCLEQFPDR